ncbi:MAG: hypothetical protein ACPHUF_14000 [Gammaproteobacteria bacterium]
MVLSEAFGKLEAVLPQDGFTGCHAIGMVDIAWLPFNVKVVRLLLPNARVREHGLD